MTFNSGVDMLKEYDYRDPLPNSSPSQRSLPSSSVGCDSTWIQPSVSQQNINTNESIIINGIYAQVMPQEINPMLNIELALEFEAWEVASDEALSLFETQLD